MTAKYIIYQIDNGKIVTEHVGEGDFEEFVSHFEDKVCRYAIIDWAFTTTDGRPASKIAFISWCPDTSPVRSKMLYAGSAAALTEVLTGVATKITATDRSEISEAILTEACKKFS
jgi:cofilin